MTEHGAHAPWPFPKLRQPYKTPDDALVIRGRGSWKRPLPLVAVHVGGARNGYLWLGEGLDGDERFLLTLSPGDARKLARWLTENFDG